MKAAFAALLLATPAMADTLSTDIGRNGIAATIAALETTEDPTPEMLFALGGLRFLSAVEAALQLQWKTGMDQAMGGIGDTLGLPFLRLPVPPNPSPEPLQGNMVTTLFTHVTKDMEAARADLARLPKDTDFGVEIAFADLWFDVNANQTRDAGEDAAAILGPQLIGRRWSERDPALPLPVIRFDVADAAWLSAYTHLLSGISEVILAYDPAASIDRMTATRAALGVRPLGPDPEANLNTLIERYLDALEVVEGALNQSPDATHSKAAKAHFLSMIQDNRRFWALVAQEKDNSAEWVPADGQTSAVGFILPPGTGVRWLAVLADIEAVLTGRELIPYWRGPAGKGINLSRLFDDPRPSSVTGWVQGWAAMPYLEKGPTLSDVKLKMLGWMMSGDAALMTIFLN